MAYAWVIPNDEKAKSANEASYRVELSELGAATSNYYESPLPSELKDGERLDPFHSIKCSGE